MLNELQPDMRELIELVRAVENYDATIVASQLAGRPIEVGTDAQLERERRGMRIAQLRAKWDL